MSHDPNSPPIRSEPAEQDNGKRGAGLSTLALLLLLGFSCLACSGLMVPAMFMGLNGGRGSPAVELGQLDNAMKQYKVLLGEYPPSSDPAATEIERALLTHIQRKFSRAENLKLPFGMTPAEALVFWLQGYSNNPLEPLSGQRMRLMQFDQTRLKPTRVVNGIQLYEYSPPHDNALPYVYFHHASYDTLSYAAAAPGKGIARAYKSSKDSSQYMNPDSFQIISAGDDEAYGADNPNKQFPAGTNYSEGDEDNITNFSGGTLKSKIP